MEAGKVELEIKPFSLYELIHSLTDLLSLRLMGKDVQLQMHRDSDVPSYVNGDSLRLHQILLNLLDNAIKFTNEGTVRLQILCSEQPDTLRFEVIDQGIGLTQEQQARIFNSYEQAEPGTARKFSGTGLALSICHKLTEVMGGAIGLSSAQGIGSTFWVELPLPAVSNEEWQAAHAAQEKSTPELSQKSSLLWMTTKSTSRLRGVYFQN